MSTEHLAREMYDSFRFGKFSYGEDRLNTDPLRVKLIKSLNTDIVLYDIGCGNGYWVKHYLDAGAAKKNVHLVDLAPSNVKELQSEGFDAVCASNLNLPINNNVSDVTISAGVIHHTDDPFKAFSELVRITKHEGLIYLNVYNAYNPYFYLVHRACYPIRFIYWNFSKDIIELLFPFIKILGIVASKVLKLSLDDNTLKVMFMDQVITPKAYLFTKNKIIDFCKRNGQCKVETFQYNTKLLMISAITRKF